LSYDIKHLTFGSNILTADVGSPMVDRSRQIEAKAARKSRLVDWSFRLVD